MKIVAISASQVPSKAANSIQALKAVHALAHNGHDVTLIVPDAENAEEDRKRPTWPELATFYGLHTEFHLEYLPVASRRLFFASAVWRARQHQPDLLYVWPLQSAVLGLLSGLPVILEMHDLPSGTFGPLWYRTFRALGGKKRQAIITGALKQALEAEYGRFSDGEVVLAPNGVEIERFAHLPDPPIARRLLNLPEAPTLVCAGHLYAGRGAELFLDLAARLPGVRFLWVGGNPRDVETWQAKAQARALNNVLFTGFVHNAQLPLYQAAADILLMPYEREIGISSGAGHSAQVASPMKMFEYLAAGRAIIASDLPVFHEVLNETNAVFCPPERPGAWEGAIRALLDDPQRRQALACQARTNAARYAWTERAKRILEGFAGNS
ncbi:MAG: glycosyltransferase family 4 protein [Anaerolineales bacterium]|nr:glycosyltransferase family 4 protein [Anaerolineales bacterium]MCX7755133.1 glycosyltransferase family 4 protein [Anaerolineales bacterium]MDW8279203.1 glycosyltransferase family 4 protein [Anaerolineales bacterium]